MKFETLVPDEEFYNLISEFKRKGNIFTLIERRNSIYALQLMQENINKTYCIMIDNVEYKYSGMHKAIFYPIPVLDKWYRQYGRNRKIKEIFKDELL